jgi:hypothetical protein
LEESHPDFPRIGKNGGVLPNIGKKKAWREYE